MDRKTLRVVLALAATLVIHGALSKKAVKKPEAPQVIPQISYVPEVTGKAAASIFEVRRRLYLAAIAVLLSIAWVVLWWVFGDAEGQKFSRSGSIVAVFTVLSESLLSEGVGRLNREMRASHGGYYTLWRGICAITAVVGTLIWGYGDWFYVSVTAGG